MHPVEVVRDYLSQSNLAARENANILWNPNGLLLHSGGAVLKRDFLSWLGAYSDRGAKAALGHEEGFIHIHDLGMGRVVPYCCGHSLPNLLHRGMDCSLSRSGPAKHLRSAMSQMVNFIGAASNEFGGAMAFNNVNTYLAPYAYKIYKREGVTGTDMMREIKQSVQEFLFGLNMTSRYGGQSPFSNITIDLDTPSDLKDQLALIAGEPIDGKTYGDLKPEAEMIAQAFLEEMIHGDYDGNPFTFPVLTINLDQDFFNSRLKGYVCKLTSKFGTPLFQNFVNGYSGGERISPQDVRAMCCRLSINQEEVRKHVGGLFGNGDSTGSIGVVTLSLPLLAAKGNCSFEADLREWLENARDVHRFKREQVQEYFNNGFFPVTSKYLSRGFDSFFSTFGYVGLWEAVSILMQDSRSFTTKEGLDLAQDILQFMAEIVTQFGREDGVLYNLEATPAESAATKLARKALQKCSNLPHQGTSQAPYFTNSCHLPANLSGHTDLLLMTQSRLQPIHTGGTIVHLYPGEDLNAQGVEAVLKTLCQTKIPYFSISPIFSICPICGPIFGEHEFCPRCSRKIPDGEASHTT